MADKISWPVGPALNPERRIGPYRIEGRLGAGGMGAVYQAYDERLERRVAVKLIRPEAAGSERARERFRREARAVAALSHPSIVHIHDVVSTEDGDAIVMELVSGAPLSRVLGEGPLAIDHVLRLGSEIAEGLQAAHDRGIVHRDLKPENIFVTPEGHAKILDFGVAKWLLPRQGEPTLSAEGAVVGTYSAMSPEQARGMDVDARSDLFSLGILLYEMLTGISPFKGPSIPDTLDRICRVRQVPARELSPELPQLLSQLVDRLLEKDPALRFQSGREVTEALSGLARRPAPPEISETTLIAGLPPGAGPDPLPEGAQPEATAARTGLRKWLPAAGIVATLALASIILLLIGHSGETVHVAVLKPVVGQGAGDPRVDLLASGLRIALLRSLLPLDGILTFPPEQVDQASGSPVQVAQAMAAQEIVSSRLNCGREVCRVDLSRIGGRDGMLLWTQSFNVPIDRPYLLAEAVEGHLKHAYPERSARWNPILGEVRPEDYAEFLHLNLDFERREETALRLDELLTRIEALRRSSPGFVDALTFEADILRYRFASRRDPADLERASALLRQARELAPEDPRPLAVSFEVAFQAEQLKEAEKALRELERLQPADTRVLTQRARLLEYRHDPERALDLMREAVRRLPSWNNLFRLAAMENRQGQREAAHRHLKELLKRFPGFYAAESLLAEVELTSGNAARAAEIYTALVRRSPQTGELANLGVANLLLRRYPEAEAQLKQALAAEPGNPFVELNLADVLLLQGREGESRAVYRQLLDRIERDPAASQWQFQTARAQALAHLGRFREAVEAVQPVLAAARDNAQAAFEVSLVYALVGDRVSALLYRERALALGFGPPWFGLPWFSSLRS